MEALSWSLFGLLAAMVAGTLAALYTLVGRIDSLCTRLDARMDSLGSRLDARMDSLGSRLDGRMDSLGSRLDALGAELRGDIAGLRVAVEDLDDWRRNNS